LDVSWTQPQRYRAGAPLARYGWHVGDIATVPSTESRSRPAAHDSGIGEVLRQGAVLHRVGRCVS